MDKNDQNSDNSCKMLLYTREMLLGFRDIKLQVHAKIAELFEYEEEEEDAIDEGALKIKHYSNKQKILLVGEGDFSFAVCLARAFGSAENMVATSLDSEATLLMHYPMVWYNLEELKRRGCRVVHGVNAHTMSKHRTLRSELFDRIVYNFPHAGFHYSEDDGQQIKMHKTLVNGFFRNAKDMVTEVGEIHVTHKNAYPYSEWDLEGLAEDVGLKLFRKVWFSLSDYEGYSNKRGSGNSCWNNTFSDGFSYTFMFVLPNSGTR